MNRRRIGILGGSFNPAHEGHRDISLAALHALGLDQVWWMVSPQNPLKTQRGMAPFVERLESARRLSDHPRIRATDIEARLSSQFTAETLEKLVVRNRDCRFVWLMGADNLDQIHRWRRWPRIFQLVPIAVFDRPSYTYRALSGVAASRYDWARVPERAIGALARMQAPAWAFVHHRLNPISATAIRAARDRLQRSRAPGGGTGGDNKGGRLADAASKEGNNHSTHA